MYGFTVSLFACQYCFLILIVLGSIAGLCQQPVGRLLVLFLLTFASMILYYVFQISSGTEFYSSVELVTRDGVSFLKKEYGPMHSLYPAFVFLCMALCFRVLAVSFFRQKRISYKVILSLFIAQMHDLGKITVDDRILRKPGRFTPEEFEEMKNHAGRGGEIVERVLRGVEDFLIRNLERYLSDAGNI